MRIRRSIRALLLMLFSAVFLVSAGMLLRTRITTDREMERFAVFASEISAAQAESQADEKVSPAAETEGSAEAPQARSSEAAENDGIAALSKYQTLSAANPDFGGWVKIEGTIVDYPVMFTPEEPEKYLHLDFDGEYSFLGTPFFGAGSSVMPRSDNLIVYGHNMKNGKMFAALLKYEDESYFREHRIVHFGTLYEEGDYEVIAAFPTDLSGAKKLRCYDFIKARDKADFDAYIAGIKAASLYDTGVAAEYGDELLTLSTCAYHATDGRFVLVARKIAQQESRN